MNESGYFRVQVTLTWSKICAVVLLALGFILDLRYNNDGRTFMYVVPFVVFLITGKQGIDFFRLRATNTKQQADAKL